MNTLNTWWVHIVNPMKHVEWNREVSRFFIISTLYVYQHRLQHVNLDTFVLSIYVEWTKFETTWKFFVKSIFHRVPIQCYFGYKNPFLKILLWNFVSHAFIAIRVVKCIFKNRDRFNIGFLFIVRSQEVPKVRDLFFLPEASFGLRVL